MSLKPQEIEPIPKETVRIAMTDTWTQKADMPTARAYLSAGSGPSFYCFTCSDMKMAKPISSAFGKLNARHMRDKIQILAAGYSSTSGCTKVSNRSVNSARPLSISWSTLASKTFQSHLGPA